MRLMALLFDPRRRAPCRQHAASFVRMVVLNARGLLALSSGPHHNQVTWLDPGLLWLEARCMEGYRDYWVKNAVSGAKNSAGLVRSLAKPPPPGKKLPPTWMETMSNAEGRILTAPPPKKKTWADACITRAPTASLQNELISPVKPRHNINICWRQCGQHFKIDDISLMSAIWYSQCQQKDRERVDWSPGPIPTIGCHIVRIHCQPIYDGIIR